MPITVDYNETPNSPNESMSLDGITCVRVLRCAWADRILLAKQMLGFAVNQIAYPPDKYVTGTDPLFNIYCTDVQITPIEGLDSTTGGWKYAQLTCTYQNIPYDPDPENPGASETYVTESLEASLQFLTLGETKLYWNSGAAPDPDQKVESDETPTKLHYNMDWVYTKHKYTGSGIPFDMIGTVNSVPVYSHALGSTFEAETLLCNTPSISREVTTEGVSAWTVTFRFTWQYEGWNVFPHVDTTEGTVAYDKIYYHDGNMKQKKIYGTYDFNGWID